MFAMFFNVVFAVFVCYPAAFCQLCFYNKDWIGLDWIGSVNVDFSRIQLSADQYSFTEHDVVSRNHTAETTL